MPRKPKASIAAPVPCPACDGAGETEQPVTRSRRVIRGQLGVCLTCLGTGQAPSAPANVPAPPHHS